MSHTAWNDLPSDRCRTPRRLALRASLLFLGAILLAPGTPARSLPDTGSIEGVVKLGSELLGRKMQFSLYTDLRRGTQRNDARTPADEIGNVVVYLEGVPWTAAPRAETHVMVQEGSRFVPHVLPVVQGSTVEFPNADPLFHNVFSLSRAATFDLGRISSGDTKGIRFDEPGVVKVFCHIHSDMSGVVVVLDSPFFAMPDESGSFRIDNVPPGEYAIRAWHERSRLVKGTVRVERGRTAVVDFTIPLEEAIPGGR